MGKRDIDHSTVRPKIRISPTAMSMNWILFGVVVVLLAWLSASYHKKQGYFFWRTFVMAVMGFAGLGLLFYKLLFLH